MPLARALIVLLATLYAWGAYANEARASHAHSHHHDDGGKQSGSHEAADHSHDKTDLTRNDAHAAPAPAGDRRAAHGSRPYRMPHFAFERPPRHPRIAVA